MKVGTGSTFYKKIEQGNTKSVIKTSTVSGNVLSHSQKDPRNRIVSEALKKSLPKRSNSNIKNNLLTTMTNRYQTTLKPNYKSTPIIKRNTMNLNTDESSVKNLVKDSNYNSYTNKQIFVSDLASKEITSRNKKALGKNNILLINNNSKEQPKNANVNLWKKPVIFGGGTPVPVSTDGNSSVKNGVKRSSTSNNNSNQNVTNNITNILTTNYTDNKKEAEFTLESTYKNTSPIHHYLDTPMSIDDRKFLNDCNHGIDNYRASHLNQKEIFHSEILSSIVNFKTMLKTDESANNIEKLFQTEEHLNKIHELNNRLQIYGGSVNVNSPYKLSDSKNLINEYNIIKRDTFIESKVNKPINIITSDMLTDYISAKPKNRNDGLLKEIVTSSNKDKIMNEIVTNSDLRLKRYEILLEFINTNLKEINQLVYSSNMNQTNHNNHHHLRTRSIGEMSKDPNRIDEVTSNKYSSLHSKINLNSRTNLILDREDIIIEESDLIDINNNFILPKNLKSESFVFSNFEFTDKDHFKNPNYEPSPSFLISSINSEFYQNLLEESYSISNNKLFSDDISSFKTQKDNFNRKLERMVSYESDKTPLQYLQFNRESNVIFNPMHKKTTELNKLMPKYTEESVVDNEGEENLEDSELDKTKEHLHLCNPRKQIYNQIIKDIERVKFFSAKNPRIETNQVVKEKMPPPKSPEDEKSKCIIF